MRPKLISKDCPIKGGLRVRLSNLIWSKKDLYLIISLDWTNIDSPVFWFLGPKLKGYGPNLQKAGIYTEEQIKYNDFFDTRFLKPIPLEKVNKYARIYEFDNGKKLKTIVNTNITRKAFGIKKKDLDI
jgi:hypothetical protein